MIEKGFQMRYKRLYRAGALLLLLGVGAPVSRAFPPAPDHVIYGMIRDEAGNPLSGSSVEVLLETDSGVQIKSSVFNGLEPGVNYRLTIPMDAGITSDLYKATALQPSVPFKIWARISGVRYLPIQMKADYAHLGEPGKSTHLDLSLGEDADGDGLPDAWERALISALGGKLTLADINPNDDADGDGLSNLQEYLAGTYAFDNQDGFTLKIAGTVGDNPVLEFLAIQGRTYRVMGSEDIKTWTEVAFRTAGTSDAAAPTYYAADTRVLRVEAVNPGAKVQFFKLMVQ
jgi:hypothetical protein